MDILNLRIEFRRGRNKEERHVKGLYYPEHGNGKDKTHRIYININKIKGLKDVFDTLIHELLHFGISVTRWRREVDGKKEHKLVYAMTQLITSLSGFIFK